MVLLSNIIAIQLKFDKEKIRSGIYGFNGILVGAAVPFYFQITPQIVFLSIIFIIITFFISSVLENYLNLQFS